MPIADRMIKMVEGMEMVKKMFEEGVEIEGQMYYKGSDPHKAAVVGDTVGDPFKDTSGPSLNILIKLMTMVSVVRSGVTVVYGLM